MANVFTKTVVGEGPRNAIMRFTGTLDTTDILVSPAVRLTDFVNNDPTGLILTGFRVDRIEWTISDPLQILLSWNAVSPQAIAALAGRSCLEAQSYGGLLPNPLNLGYDGNINLTTSNYPGGGLANFTILLALVKLYSR